eukprot:gene8214-5918_t
MDDEKDNRDEQQRKRIRVESAPMPGKVFIASMNLRGTWAPKPADVDKVLNVTSAQGKDNINRLTFSPMTPVPGGYKGFWNFEHYWQSGKRVLHAIFEDVSDERMDYISSRKLVYVPQYAKLIENSEVLDYWRTQLQMGQNIIVYDFDGPRLEDGDVTAELCTLQLLRTKINDTRHPFGHGYVVAALLMDIDVRQFTDSDP